MYRNLGKVNVAILLVSGQRSLLAVTWVPSPWDSAQHISCHPLSLPTITDRLPANQSRSFSLPPLRLVSMLFSSPLIISVTDGLCRVAMATSLDPRLRLGSPHQSSTLQPHLGDDIFFCRTRHSNNSEQNLQSILESSAEHYFTKNVTACILFLSTAF